VQLSPHLAPAHSNLASALKEQGQVGRALAHYQQAIALDPFLADAHSE
jgi:tetratricopeptide (TPR) repeat protein